MHSGSMSLMSYPELCSAIPYRTHCYIPVTPSIAFCSNDVSSTIGHYLPSSYQGNLWLLDHCQETYCDVPSCDSPSCELKTCATNCDPQNSCVSCDSLSPGQVITACKTTNLRSSPSCSPCTQTKGYVSNCYTTTLSASKACQTLRNESNCFGQLNYLSKRPQPRSHCRLGVWAYRSYPTFGFFPGSFSPACNTVRRYQPRNYLLKNHHYLNCGPMSYRPLSYSCSKFRSLSCIPSSFPPLRYLCSGYRPLSCY
ncbi:PREDICTED: keratin-associated protein 24-1 [Chinchilla lanigera]|uniref:keratin-associated protein 24-1 n=1 Tax=Chinchilla lanigera TaxID=34839 RepID=UPI00038EA603|nr:PREDICTED: keratin-associated protein 24-1 [Chinchilla lanigera]